MKTKYDNPVIQFIILGNDCIRTSEDPIFSGLTNGGEYDVDDPNGKSEWGDLFG